MPTCVPTLASIPAPLTGKGAFGVVRLVQDKKMGRMYACKSISKAKLISKEDVDDVRREVGAGLGARRLHGPAGSC